jgi:hypothetical protein
LASLDDSCSKDPEVETSKHTFRDFEEWQSYGVDEGSSLVAECESLGSSGELCGAEFLGRNLSADRDAALQVHNDFFGAPRGKRPTAGAIETSTWREIHTPASRISSGIACGLRRGALIGD